MCSTGRRVEHAELEKALHSTTEFTQEEWDAFGVSDLRVDDYIKALLQNVFSYYRMCSTTIECVLLL